MNKLALAIVDIDGVIANSEARFAKAALARHSRMLEFELPVTQANEQEGTALYWQTAFTPELVSLDTLIDGAKEALASIKNQGYTVILLTSRPESMRSATMHWLLNNGLWESYNTLIHKAPAFQYTKTTVWKAGMVQTLASLHMATTVLVVDDEEANRVEIAKYERSYELAFACSMADAITVINMP